MPYLFEWDMKVLFNRSTIYIAPLSEGAPRRCRLGCEHDCCYSANLHVYDSNEITYLHVTLLQHRNMSSSFCIIHCIKTNWCLLKTLKIIHHLHCYLLLLLLLLSDFHNRSPCLYRISICSICSYQAMEMSF